MHRPRRRRIAAALGLVLAVGACQGGPGRRPDRLARAPSRGIHVRNPLPEARGTRGPLQARRPEPDLRIRDVALDDDLDMGPGLGRR